ncbi:MAG: thermonuclease family protein [Hyphomicrobiales bacterium]
MVSTHLKPDKLVVLPTATPGHAEKLRSPAVEVKVLGNRVECDNRGSDEYGRIIAVCLANGEEINAALVREGLAWAFVKFSDDYVTEELKARSNATGIWQAPTQTAWDFRAERWAVGEQEAPNGCPIKGNISGNGRIYHAPWSPWYNRTKISVEKGERWFCDEAEALAAGWRAPYWGR